MPPVTLDEVKVVEADTLLSFLAVIFSMAASCIHQRDGSLANITPTINRSMLCLLGGGISTSLVREI